MENPTPIYTALQDYARGANLRLHMPGHIGKMAILSAEFDRLARMDVTEIMDMDDFHMPGGIIAASQGLMQKAFRSAASYYLVNGATSGIQSLILCLSGEDDTVIVARNSHRSLFAALVLSGARPVYIPVEREPTTGISLSVKGTALWSTWQQNPQARFAFLTSPSYYGTTSDIKRLVQVAGDQRGFIVVDEAHGSHFPFHTGYPVPALQQGAAAVVNGMHKTLPVLNQGACLHLGDPFPAEKDRLQACLSLLTTTSPSYPLLASMELARHFMETKGNDLLDLALERSRRYRGQIERIRGLKTLVDEMKEVPGVKEIDPLKVVVSVGETGLSGYQFARLLRDDYRIQVEMADDHTLLAMFSILHREEDWELFTRALETIASRYPGPALSKTGIDFPPSPRVILTPRQAFNYKTFPLKLEDCSGYIAGEMLTPYPPGIPCLLPGEAISPEMLNHIEYLKKNRVAIQGPRDPDLSYLQVIDPE